MEREIIFKARRQDSGEGWVPWPPLGGNPRGTVCAWRPACLPRRKKIPLSKGAVAKKKSEKKVGQRLQDK